MTALKRVLVPHNLSDTSETAMKYAMALARTFGAKLHLFHVSGKRRRDIATKDSLGIGPRMEAAGGAPRQKIVAPAARKDRPMPRRSTLDGFADELLASEGVSLLDLEPLTTLLVRTRHSVYRIILLRGTTVLVRGGPCFPDVTIGHLRSDLGSATDQVDGPRQPSGRMCGSPCCVQFSALSSASNARTRA